MSDGARLYDIGELRRRARARAAQRVGQAFDGQIYDGTVAGVRVRHYLPRTIRPSATTFFFLHGGYGLFGDVELQDGYCRLLAMRLAHGVTAIDYPLAPEHTFAQAIAAVQAVLREENTGVTVLAGDSAGGALAVATARAGDEWPERVDGLLLTNPNLDLTLSSLDTDAPAGPDSGLMSHAFTQWLGEEHAGLRLDEDARLLPRTLVAVGTDDSLAPEARALHSACERARVPAQLLEFEAVGHGIVKESHLVERIADEARVFFRLPAS
ncbi:alpha/beta hydrolase [Dermacoccus abyssi]|uniref:Alpha/beta hydrolase n=1 Tax=Dermacoccus abyssi TaxID=322596 RepID=A0ABX5Z7V3_9MICO|nr:alpha/beta hydrolase [Dermacoccus abyssi]